MLMDWGKSMYGGWYMNYINGSKMEGKHFKTMKEMKAWAKENGYNLSIHKRDDH